MADGGCNVCNPDLRRAAEEGRAIKPDVENNNCRVCRARPRIRAMAFMVDTSGADICRRMCLYGQARALLAAPDAAEKTLLKPLTATMTTFSLFGKYGANHHTCNVEELAPFSNESFDLFEACSVLDFVPDLPKAMASISRVLAKRAVIFIHFDDSRLLDGSQPPQVMKYRTEYSAGYYPKDYKQPIVKVGREWFADGWRRHGFSVEQVVWKDFGFLKPITWWVGWRDAS